MQGAMARLPACLSVSALSCLVLISRAHSHFFFWALQLYTCVSTETFTVVSVVSELLHWIAPPRLLVEAWSCRAALIDNVNSILPICLFLKKEYIYCNRIVVYFVYGKPTTEQDHSYRHQRKTSHHTSLPPLMRSRFIFSTDSRAFLRSRP